MPSPKALWYAGAAAAATAVVGGVVLIVREVRKSKKKSPDGLEGGWIPPTAPPGQIPVPGGIGFKSPGDELRAEICRQWKVGNHRPKWRAELWSVVQGAVDQQIAIQDTQWSDIDELRLKAFRVARGALASVCPEVPLPGTIYGVEEMRKAHGFYWSELWDVFYTNTYGILSGAKSGP